MSSQNANAAPTPIPKDKDLRALLLSRIASHADSPAYVFLGRDLEVAQSLSYGELGSAAATISQHLRGLTRPGDRVLLAFNNDLEAVQLFWGCVLARVIPIPAPAPDIRSLDDSGSRLRGIASDAGVALALTHESHLATARAQIPCVPWRSLPTLLAEPPAPDQTVSTPATDSLADMAYLQYTSGSTSAPRGVQITHGNLLAQCQAMMSGLGTQGVRALTWLPWFHDYGLVHGVIQPLFSGGVSFLMATGQFLLRPLRWLEAIEKHHVTHSGAPNFAYAACVQALSRTPKWSAQLDGWQLATCGAEPVRSATLDAFAAAFAPHGFDATVLAPSYGLAEAVLAVTVRDIRTPLQKALVDAQALEQHEVKPAAAETPGTRTLVGCGPALPGFQLRIVDPATALPCAAGRVGEIWVAGPSVGRGYWQQPAATAESFGATLAGEHADGLPYLRTGDLGFLREGELFVTGRLKDLIVVNGRNLYPQDLERAAELADTDRRSGRVIAVSVDQGQKEAVVMLVECQRHASPEAVRELIDGIQKRVATEHQLDLHEIVPLRAGSLPLTSSGKPQRSAARRLYLQGALEPMRLAVQTPSLPTPAPENDAPPALMDELSRLWCDVLGVESVEPDAHFFELGGDSLLATQLMSRLRTRLGVELPIRALFENPTLPGLARAVMQAPAAPAESASPEAIKAPERPRPPGARVALTFSQERMWVMHELDPQGSAYNVPLAIRLSGPLNVSAMQAALSRVVERHEILRTRFVKSPEGVFAEVVAAPPVVIDEVRMPDDGTPASRGALMRHLAEVACLPFQLDRCPLFRTQVIHTGEQQAVLLIVMHHIVCDQWSFAQLGRELAAHYSAIQAGVEATVPSLPIQYADYASWHRPWFEGERRARELSFWSRRLEGMEPLPLNEDFVRPRQQSFRGAAIRFPLTPEDITSLRQLGTAHGASLSMVFMAALNVMLHRHTGKTDIPIGVPIANRHQLASENLIGTLVNTLVFRTDLNGDPDFATVLARVRDVSLEAFAHQDMPFELLVQELAGRAGAVRQPLFNVMFNQVNVQARESDFAGLQWSRLDFDRASTQFDLTIVADMLYDQSLVFEYATDLFTRETVQRMGEHVQNILRAAVAASSAHVSTIPLLSEAERDRLQTWSLGPSEPPAARTIVEWVAGGLAPSAHKDALVFGQQRLTHQALDEESNRLARWLRQRGIARGSRVGLCLPRGNDLVIALLAILKTGAAYVPLDPAYPVQRLNHQIDDADMALLITHSSVALPREQPPRLLLDVDRAQVAATAATPLEADALRDAGPEDPAYVIYTSGSTGVPKGVVVPHRAVVNFLASMARRPGLTAQDRLLAVTTPSFDIAALELFLPLGVGGTVVIANEEQCTDGRALSEVLRCENITTLQATPSRWHLLIDSGWKGSPQLKALVGGEPLTPQLATLLLTRCAEVWNMYGPTETTIWSSCWKLPSEATQAIALGPPIANTSIQVLDQNLQPCPIGVPGEIYIGGTGVALGYYKRPELTAERFIDQPDAQLAENRRIYRTGDGGRWRHDGSLEHLGRLDDQIKIRGFRVELGEIETNLLTHSGVSRAIVSLREDLPGQPRLVAYVVPHGPMPLREHLRQHLRQALPDHMVPAVFMEMDAIPVLPNGKTDRRALPVPPSGHTDSVATMVAPRNDIERTIAAIWQQTLQIGPFGVHDNFFDLGGHSLLAVGVVSRMEAALKRPCPLRLLFERPTVADLAAALEQPADAPVVPVAVLQPHGDGPGLFLLAGTDQYRHLARELGAQMPVYGVFSQTEIDLLRWPADAPPPTLSVETLALEYIDLIRGIQPHGPYFLGGFSIGGVLAYEVAQRLQAAGEEIGLIVLLDSMLPGRGVKYLWAGICRRLRMIRRQGVRHLLHVFRVYKKQVNTRHEPGSLRIRAYTQAIRNYNATPADLPVVFLQAADDASTTPAYGWRSLVPGLSVTRVPGRHMDILEPPNVDVLVSHLREHVISARAAFSAATPPVE
ncbi:non-ribosomal peptide synthetase [Hydrogenophaga palleronii]|uniref:non-ribosomal peptide synthetase n=1 Tax=Hydrogenophaga palleronii TaxID=65655 RepID=UPI0008265988|nr:non-ribosomal peptide synthetase [Hydrogenophaga palleronii]